MMKNWYLQSDIMTDSTPMKLTFETLRDNCSRILEKYGFNKQQAAQMADVFTETTFDGVFSHGINRFPRFIRDVKAGTVDAGAQLLQKFSSPAFEQWDGNRGPGISNALECTDRAIGLARENGIGCVALRNTNHWMRGGTYGLRAARNGFLFMGWTNTIPNMPPWEGKSPALGNNPFIMGIPYRNGPVVLDMAMSLYSYGKLEWHQRKGLELAEYGGYDSLDRLTRNPKEILQSGRILPAGLWKGSAFALVLDLAAAILSGGITSREIGALESETALSQVFIAVDPRRTLTEDQLEAMVEQTLSFQKEMNPGTRFPGQRSARDRRLNRQQGIEIPDALWEELMGL